MKILVVEDERPLADALRRGLVQERYVVEVVHDGDEADWAIRGGGFDVVLLDIRLPGLSGLEVCRRVRQAGERVPILLLTALDATSDVVAGLDAGANDYLTKPFAFDELLARIRAACRSRAAPGSMVCVGDVAVDTAGRTASVAGEEMVLTTKEFQLLEYFVAHAGTALPHARLASALWPDDGKPDSNSLEVYVGKLRRKIGRGARRPSIATIRGFGYVMREP